MDKGLETLTLQVKGMDCAQEVALIEKQLTALPGVRSWQPNLITHSLTVRFDTSALTQEALIKAVEATGMKASLDHIQELHAPRPWWKERHIIFLATCGILTGLGYVLEKLGIPVLAAQGLYTAAILIGGYYPARIGIAAFRTWTLNINTLLIFATVAAVFMGLWEEAALLVFVYSLGNVLENPHVGCLFIDFMDGARLRINGHAHIHETGEFRDLFKSAPRVVLVDIQQVVPNCAAHVPRLIPAESEDRP